MLRTIGCVALLWAGMAAAGCERRSAGDGRATAIEANLQSLRQVPGRVKSTDGAESPFTAYFQQMDLQLVEERPAEGSPIRQRYYFVEGKLFYFRQLRDDQVDRQFLIDRKGKLRNAVPAPFPEQEYTRIAGRADALKQAALERAGHMFVFPLMRNR